MKSSVISFVVVAVSLCPMPTQAQPSKQYQIEFAILSSLNHVREVWPDRWDCDVCGNSETRTYFGVPGVAPGLRITAWGGQPLLFDVGLTYFSSSKDSQFSDTHLLLEFGFSMDLGQGQDKWRPFAGAVGGVLATEDPRTYLGVQGGFRYFLREYAAARLQAGYRATLAESYPKYRAIELAFGLSFLM